MSICPLAITDQTAIMWAIYKSPVVTAALSLGKVQARCQEQKCYSSTVRSNHPQRQCHHLLVAGNSLTWVPWQAALTAAGLHIRLDYNEAWSSSRNGNLASSLERKSSDNKSLSLPLEEPHSPLHFSEHRDMRVIKCDSFFIWKEIIRAPIGKTNANTWERLTLSSSQQTESWPLSLLL